MVSTDTGVKVFGNTDQFHYKWNSMEDRDKKLLEKDRECFLTNGDRMRKSFPLARIVCVS